ncbi:MAG: helix-turn-helix transcriptional regulator [Eubacteriales bacterium]|nr:helix-turn-helix transcriptional regulator [Eubacteriales bacterium]
MDKLTVSLKAARVNADLTQSDTAKLMHRTKQTIVNWESGATDISYRDLLALCKIYGIPIEYIRLPQRKSSEAASLVSKGR